jgi:hypothetical protein
MPFGTETVNIPAHYVWRLDYICCYKYGTPSILQSYMRKISRVHYLDSKCENWKFPDWESIKLLDLPYLHVGIISFKLFHFWTSYIAVSNTVTPVSRCLSPPPAIQLEFLSYSRIFVYLTALSSLWKRTPCIVVLSFLTWSCLSMYTANMFCFSCHSADVTQIVRQFASCFNFPFQHVSVYHIVDLEWYIHRWSYNWGPCLWRDAVFHFVISTTLRQVN